MSGTGGAHAQRFETYPGLESFRDDDVSRKLYAGREVETNALLDLVVGEPLVVLFSRSGLGKTSLINAGLMQPLRDRGFFAVVARVTLLPDPIESVISAIQLAAERQGVTISGGKDSSLWQYLNTARFEVAGRPVKLVLVLDQFEELFTRVRESRPEAEPSFISDLANVVRRRLPDDVQKANAEELERLEEQIEAGDQSEATRARRDELVHLLYEASCTDVKVLIALREDYLPDLERLREPMPTVFHKMMRLDPLTPTQARCAIELPAARDDIPGKEVIRWEEGAIQLILEFLKKRRVDRGPVLDASIDPGQLQLICHHIDARRQETVITAAELRGEKGLERILKRFYRDTLALIPPLRIGPNAQRMRVSRTNLLLFNRPRAAVRLLCQHGLITRGGHRDSMMHDTIRRRFGVDQDLETLETRKLVRSTTRQDREFFELSHDTLVRPLQAAAARRRYVNLALVYLLLCLVPFAIHELGDLWERQKSRTLEAAYRGRNERIARQIAGGNADLSRQDLSGIVFTRQFWRGGSAVEASLRGASLSFTTFEGVDLTAADVSAANLDGCTFYLCRLGVSGRAPKFTHASFAGSSMKGANIPGADFSEAVLRDLDLTGAVLTDAKFVNASVDGADFTGSTIAEADFTGTAWWLASGWTSSQISDLSARYPVKELAKSLRYKLEMDEFDLDPDERDVQLNNRAWHRAVRGADLDLALADVEQSLKERPDAPAALDTRAYIRLQRGDAEGALHDSKRSVAKRKEASCIYRLALAEMASRDRVSAARHFAEAARLGYKPTFELVLTPPDDPLRHVRRVPRVASTASAQAQSLQ